MIPRQFAIGSIVVALTFFAAAIAGCGGGGGGGAKTPSGSRSPAATSSSVATATTPSLGIRELDLSKVDDVTAIVASTGGQFVQTSVIYADLTGDGVDEAIVPISSGGTMGDVAFLVLAASGRGTKTLLKEVPLGASGGLSVAVLDGQLVMTQAIYGPEDPNCCPSALRRTTYVWNGTSLAVQSIKTEVSPSGGGKKTPAPTP